MYYDRKREGYLERKRRKRKMSKRIPKEDNIVEYKDGMTYAERQKKETVEMFARIKL